MKLTISYDPWREQPFFIPRSADSAVPLPQFTHLSTTVPKRESTIRDALIALIDSATQRVFVCSFLVGGEAMRDVLRRAAQRLCGHVYVVVALDEKSLQRGLELEPNQVDPDDLKREIKNFEALTRHGIYVRGAENCHAKFCIVDDRAALVGSANFDPNGLGEEGGVPCGELGIVIDGSERVAPLAQLFRHLWKCGCQREAPPLRDDYRLSGVSPITEALPSVPKGSDAVVWTGFKSTAILAGIQSVITTAQHTLLLASYSFTSMREKPALILDALAAARKRGVQVELLLRDRSRDLPEIAALIDLGVEVRANRDNHAKYAIADGDNGLLFSANFDGVHGLTDGIETGVWLRPDEASEVEQWHSQMWREAPTLAAQWPTANDFAKAVPDILCECPPFFGESLRITGDAETIKRCAAMLEGPCLIVGDHGQRLVGFQDVIRLEPTGTEMKAVGLDRNDAMFLPLPRLIAMGQQRRPSAWLPLGLEIHLP